MPSQNRRSSARPRLLLISMYPLDRGLWGPTVRITHLRDELATMAQLEVIEGYRGARRRRLWGFAASGRLRGLDGIYVESSTFLPAESDIAFLALARSLGIPVLTYFRDAYQLFPEDYPIDSPRRWLARQAFLPAVRALAAVSSTVAVPSPGLGSVLFGERHRVLLLPPGAPPPVLVDYDPAATEFLFVGSAGKAAHGADRLIGAVEMLRAEEREIRLRIVARPGEEPPGELPDWLTITRASGTDIHGVLLNAVACVIPRPRGRYNDLALPIKLYDYLSYARPVLVTPCVEQARVVEGTGAGLVIDDRPAGMAADLARFLDLPDEERASMARRARDAALGAPWRDRADLILQALGVRHANGADRELGTRTADH